MTVIVVFIRAFRLYREINDVSMKNLHVYKHTINKRYKRLYSFALIAFVFIRFGFTCMNMLLYNLYSCTHLDCIDEYNLCVKKLQTIKNTRDCIHSFLYHFVFIRFRFICIHTHILDCILTFRSK